MLSFGPSSSFCLVSKLLFFEMSKTQCLPIKMTSSFTSLFSKFDFLSVIYLSSSLSVASSSEAGFRMPNEPIEFPVDFV